jgi:ADP-ribosylglycohydrolase
VIAPSLGFVGLAILSVMTAVNLPLLVGGSDTLAAIIGVLLAGAFLGGAAVAVLRPHAGHQDSDTDKEIAR